MKAYLLSLDQGTTSSRAVLFDTQGQHVFSAQYEYPQIFPQAGWVEHDPYEILNTQLRAARDCMDWLREHAPDADVAAVGVTNQRETTIVWDKTTGKPVYNAIVWQCRRTAEECRVLEKQGVVPLLREKTGETVDTLGVGGEMIRMRAPGARTGDMLRGEVRNHRT